MRQPDWQRPGAGTQGALCARHSPGGEPGLLQSVSGLDTWQQDILNTIAEGLSPQRAVQIAVASGHGPGKTALVAWIILWAMLTEADTRGVVTANTESQLRTKTWAELAKWFRLCPLLTEFFILTATTLAARDPTHAKTWRIDAVPWTENRVEAFAGLHNQGRRILVVFDEASAIPDLIWETTEGALTDEQTEIFGLFVETQLAITGASGSALAAIATVGSGARWIAATHGSPISSRSHNGSPTTVMSWILSGSGSKGNFRGQVRCSSLRATWWRPPWRARQW